MRLLVLVFISFMFLIVQSFKKADVFFVKDTQFSPDTTIFPKVDSNYVVKLLKPGKYNLDEINYDANTMVWFGLLSNGVSHLIRIIQPSQEKIKDENGNEKWSIKGHDSLITILMMSGVEMLEREVIEMKLGNKTFNVGDRLELNYNGKKFVVTADGDEKKDKSTKKKYIANYRLYIAPLKKENNKTLLVYHKRIDEVFPNIIFMGDLDNDKKPDLILNNTNTKAENHIMLYLTNNAPKGSMFKVMGVFNFKN